MSFGFSVGDFLAVIELVTRLRKDFANAPSHLRDLSAELKTFSIVLQDTEVDLTESELEPAQIQALDSTLSSARIVLGDIQKFIEKHKDVSNPTGPSKARGSIKRIWKRLNFDPQEVSKFRLQLSSINSGLHAFSSAEVKHNTRKIARYTDTRVHKEVLEWLSDDDFDYHKNYLRHLVSNRQAGTRKWLFGSHEWASWLEFAGRTLYCPGIPGSGKTFTTAMTIENIDSLSEEHGWVFAYVFCNYQQRKENMHERLLRSLLRMILEQSQQISGEIQRWPTRSKEIGIDEILEQLRIAIKGCPRVFLVVDALDELDELQTFVSYLFDLQKAADVNLYFTSRDIPHIRILFNAAVIVPIKATEHDVGVYLDHQMTMPHVPNFVRKNQTLQDEVKKIIVSAVGEMQVHPRYMLVKQLMQSKSTRRLQIALQAITFGMSTYETAYEAAMERIQSQEKRKCELAKDAISILAYAERPLLAPELVHALSVDFDLDDSPGPELQTTEDLYSTCHNLGVYDPDLMPTIEDVLAASAGLIVHQPDSGIVQLVHKTTKDYLMSDNGRQKWFPRAQLTIAAICLIYSQAFEDSDVTAHWPFLDYAQKHYGHHIIMAQQSLKMLEQPTIDKSPPGSTLDHLQDTSLLQAQQRMDRLGLARMAQELGRTEDALILACEKNQLNLARVLLSTNQYSQSTELSERTDTKSPGAEQAHCAVDRALMAAVENGHVELVELLLKKGASPMAQSEPGGSLLAIASRKGHHKVVAYFLDNGYYTMAMMRHDLDGLTCVNESPVPPLFQPHRILDGSGNDTGPLPTPHDFNPHSPICLAAHGGHPMCVKVLLRWIGIETNESFRNAEQERILENVTLGAMARSHDKVLEVLPRLNERNMASMLRILRDPNLLYTSIRWSEQIWAGYELTSRRDAVAELLLRTYNFDLSDRDARGANVLAFAANAGMPQIVRLILERSGAVFNSHRSGCMPPFVAQRSMNSARVLPGQSDIQTELLVSCGMESILEHFTLSSISAIQFMIPYLEHGINTILRDGCTLLHLLIEPNHRKNLEHYKGRNIFENPDLFVHVSSESDLEYAGFAFCHEVLRAISISADEIRSSPCKCGTGTIFLAISSQDRMVVSYLLDLYPELLNDEYFDGSSPLDLAKTIRESEARKAMINVILSERSIGRMRETASRRSGISGTSSDEAQD